MPPDQRLWRQELYEQQKAQGLLLSEHLDQQLREIGELPNGWGKRAHDSGLLLDVLHAHTTPQGTAKTLPVVEYNSRYAHIPYREVLAKTFTDRYLLVDPLNNKQQLRLAHDTLAGVVKARYDTSDLPGQRAQRVLDSRKADWEIVDDKPKGTALDTYDLKLVEQGQEGTRDWQQDSLETAIVHKSRKRRRNGRIVVGSVVATLVLAFIATVFLYLRAEEQRREAAAAKLDRTVSLFDSTTTHSSLLTKIEDVAAASEKLKSIRMLDAEIPANRRYARDLLAGYASILGGKAEYTYEDLGVQLNGDVAISPDGYWLVVSGERGTIALFERESGKLVQKLEGHDKTAGSNGMGTVRDIVFHHKHPWLFSAGDDGLIILWAVPLIVEGKATILQQWKTGSVVSSLALTPDGKVLASGHVDGKVRLWEIGKGQETAPKLLRVLEGHESVIANGWGLAFSPDGRQLASASYDKTVRLWDWKNKKSEPEILRGSQSDFNGVAFSDDGKLLAASGDTHILMWDIETGSWIRELKGHHNMIFGLQFLKEDLLASASSDNTIRLWDVQTGVTRRILQGHAAAIGGVICWKERGKRLLYSSSNDGTVKRWSGDLPGQWLVDLAGEGISSAISPDGKYFAVGLQNGAIEVYALPDVGLMPDLLQKIEKAHDGQVLRLIFNEDSSLLASGSHDNKAKVWKVGVDGKLMLERTIDDHNNSVHSVTFSSDGSCLATASYDGRIGLFMLEGEKKTLFEAHSSESSGGVASISFDSSGKKLLSAGIKDFALKLWNTDIQQPTFQTVATAKDRLMWVSFSPDGSQFVSVGRGGSVSVHPVHSHTEPFFLNGHEQTVYKAIFSPDSHQLATVSMDMTVRVWDLDSQAELFHLRLPTEFSEPSPLWDFDFRCTPTGCWIAVPLTSGKLALYNVGKIDYVPHPMGGYSTQDFSAD